MSSANQIKLEALKLFSAHGYDGTSMESIAGQVGIRKSSMYSHFKGKEQLFLTIVDHLIHKNREILRQLSSEIATWSTKDKLYAVYRHLSCYPLETDQSVEFDFFRRMVFFPPISLKSLLLEKISAYDLELKDLLVTIFIEGIDNGTISDYNIYDLVISFICNADGVMMQIQYYSKDAFNQVAQSAWNMYWTGICTSHSNTMS